MDASIIQKISVWVIPVLFAISLHEAAHAWMANRKGDATAKLLGRLTFNPFKHIDPVGTVVVPAVMIALTGFAFGWAKPVPVDARNFKDPKKDMMWVAMAGPASNLIMAVFWAITLRLGAMSYDGSSSISLFVIYASVAGIIINTVLCVLNLLPVPPLDGSRILSGFLSAKASQVYNKIEPYGFFIVVALLATGLLGLLLSPFINTILFSMASISGIDVGTFIKLLSAVQ